MRRARFSLSALLRKSVNGWEHVPCPPLMTRLRLRLSPWGRTAGYNQRGSVIPRCRPAVSGCLFSQRCHPLYSSHRFGSNRLAQYDRFHCGSAPLQRFRAGFSCWPISSGRCHTACFVCSANNLFVHTYSQARSTGFPPGTGDSVSWWNGLGSGATGYVGVRGSGTCRICQGWVHGGFGWFVRWCSDTYGWSVGVVR
jgi:hypothetical protein